MYSLFILLLFFIGSGKHCFLNTTHGRYTITTIVHRLGLKYRVIEDNEILNMPLLGHVVDDYFEPLTNSLISKNSSTFKLFESDVLSTQVAAYSLVDLFCDKSITKFFYWRATYFWSHCHIPVNSSQTTLIQGSIGIKVVDGTKIIPIFIIFNEKITDLKEMLLSIHERLESSFHIVIVDFGSRTPGAINFLHSLELAGVSIVRKKRLLGMRMLNNEIRREVQKYLLVHPEVDKYVVSDCDISLAGVEKDFLIVLSKLLDAFPVNIVGPALRLDDIPSDPFYKDFMNRERTFWNKNGSFEIEPGKIVFYSEAPIDTTFGLLRASFSYRNGNQGFRVHSPYAARHLDWYFNISTGFPQELVSYICNSKKITHALVPGLNCPKRGKQYNLF